MIWYLKNKKTDSDYRHTSILCENIINTMWSMNARDFSPGPIFVYLIFLFQFSSIWQNTCSTLYRVCYPNINHAISRTIRKYKGNAQSEKRMKSVCMRREKQKKKNSSEEQKSHKNNDTDNVKKILNDSKTHLFHYVLCTNV